MVRYERFQLWIDDTEIERHYLLCGIESDGQVSMLATFQQGPFDSRLEVAQWAWREMSKHLPE